ncbi:uncharacterized protein LOC105420885 [Amborella trichopoda]|uniref:uncharacterized protein LOC105420885 n=1 Tax=Amborella trichopoda TaxID=13333 RepID=UPI0005D3629D|nr:uncharacterized protein LOC105420885 [Amborella trichopoda]|eukprot:XP_011624478.1 uncharacterized protein LOC105420885 [Amborella trichopoda]
MALFWHSKWESDLPMKALFPDIYHRSLQHMATMHEEGSGSGSGQSIVWNVTCLYNRLPAATFDQCLELQSVLGNFFNSSFEEDAAIWELESDGAFSVRLLFGFWRKVMLNRGQFVKTRFSMNLPSSVWHIVNQLKILEFQGFGGILWNIFRGSLLWGVWLKRNRKTFESVAVDLATLKNKILLYTWNWFRITKKGCGTSRMDVDENLDQLISLRFIKVRPRSSWQPPLSGCFKLNVDGSFIGNPSRARVGGVCRDTSGNLALCFARPCGDATANYIEMAAVLQGIKLWKEMSLGDSLFVEGDSKNAMDWCNCLSIAPWCIRYIWLHIKELSAGSNITFNHIYIEANTLADDLVKKGASLPSLRLSLSLF